MAAGELASFPFSLHRRHSRSPRHVGRFPPAPNPARDPWPRHPRTTNADWEFAPLCSRQAIKKYIQANNDLGGTTEAAFNSHINRALTAGDGKVFTRPKGMSVRVLSPIPIPFAGVGRKPHDHRDAIGLVVVPVVANFPSSRPP